MYSLTSFNFDKIITNDNYFDFFVFRYTVFNEKNLAYILQKDFFKQTEVFHSVRTSRWVVRLTEECQKYILSIEFF